MSKKQIVYKRISIIILVISAIDFILLLIPYLHYYINLSPEGFYTFKESDILKNLVITLRRLRLGLYPISFFGLTIINFFYSNFMMIASAIYGVKNKKILNIVISVILFFNIIMLWYFLSIP